MKVQLSAPKKARIEMLPLIDIVFLLLVFFIYAMLSMAVHRGLPVELPFSSTAEIDKKLVLSVTIKADQSIYVDKERVALADLTEVLREIDAGSRISVDELMPVVYNDFRRLTLHRRHVRSTCRQVPASDRHDR